MHCIRLLSLALAALVVHAAPGRGKVEERDGVGNAAGPQVYLSEFPRLIEPYPGYYASEFNHRPFGALASVCATYTANDKEPWRFMSASCQRENPNNNTWFANCVQDKSSPPKTQQYLGECAPGYVCSDIWGRDDADASALNVLCTDSRGTRSWYIGPSEENCSPFYVNDLALPLRMDLEVNVYDFSGLHRVDSDFVYFRVNEGDKVGSTAEMASIAASGKITVLKDAYVQACVRGLPNQALWASSHLVGLQRSD